jgi:hypothetical protein
VAFPSEGLEANQRGELSSAQRDGFARIEDIQEPFSGRGGGTMTSVEDDARQESGGEA